MEDTVTAVIAELSIKILLLSFCLKRSVKFETTLKTEHNRPFASLVRPPQSHESEARDYHFHFD